MRLVREHTPSGEVLPQVAPSAGRAVEVTAEVDDRRRVLEDVDEPGTGEAQGQLTKAVRTGFLKFEKLDFTQVMRGVGDVNTSSSMATMPAA